jgi:leader peptidase (prepilin peptidase)/N-methyltransferase
LLGFFSLSTLIRQYNHQMHTLSIPQMLLLVAMVGLLINYLADVLPIHRKLIQPTWWPLNDKEKLTNYFSQTRVLLVFISLLVFGILAIKHPDATWPLWQLALIFAFFALVIVIDIEHRLILHSVSIAGALILGSIGILRHGWASTLLGGAAGFALLLLLYWLGGQFGNWMARRRGKELDEIVLGFGDVNLAGVIGLLVGWPSIAGALFLGILFGGLYSLAYILVSLIRGKYEAFAAIPYGPFLSLGVLTLIVAAAYF